ncbi:MAG: hypothetical protein GX547_16335 [Phycisphaerae bacterium]|nr:hypothetical protein [Phycisphaerae bacterium]
MLAEALNKLEQMAITGHGATVVPISRDPRTAYLECLGEVKEVDLAPPPRADSPGTLADLWAVAAHLANRWEIWVDTNQVTLLHFPGLRPDASILRLCATRQHQNLTALVRGSETFTQNKLVRFLRFELGAPLETILPFRRIIWNSKGATQGTAAQNASAYGHQIEQEVTGQEPLPEVIRLDVPLWDTPCERAPYRIEIAVEYNHGDQTISLSLVPGSLEAALTAHQELMFSRLCTMAADVASEERPSPALILRGDPADARRWTS